MLTLRAMDENGKWLPKSKNVYALDENGNRIRTPNGRWKRVKVNTVDWNERKYGEIWRQDWAAAQNAALEAAGRAERVDMRSLERQGVEDRLPQKHLGPTASALERKAEMAELNRIRYWTCKVIPDALPHVLDGRVSIEDAMETASNRKELEQVINDAEKNALRQSDDPLQTNQSAPIHFLAI